ncbi:response regulator transcription factor, partial [Virgisporangium aurantiacum]|uniref:response regulator transcription factor n=1 Tax=Virgisporangium aurantiacum TaxID=175570 RepID=UPI001952469C
AYAVAAATADRRGATRRAVGAARAGRPVAERLVGVRTPDLAGLRRAGTAGLTPREREIARLAAPGTTSQAIAASLVVSARTVDNHLQNVYRKLGVRNRTELRAALDRDR